VNQLPSTYVLEKFYTYAGAPTFNKFTKVYNASCPVCREGKSWLKKKRLFYYPTTNTFYCFNCTKSWNSYSWIYHVTGMSKEEVQAEVHSGNSSRDISKDITIKKTYKIESSVLPYDSINLNDFQQKCFYGTNKYFQDAIEYIESRKLNTAVNKSSAYYLSLTDPFHKNRLCIPYYDIENKIVFYQTRALDNDSPRYLNKVGYDKTLFGIERVDPNIDYLFLFEGPLDAIMVRNGLAVAGLTLTETQQKQLSQFPFHQKIWVLDNPRLDTASKDNTIKLLEQGEKVFKWIDKPYKDFNEWAVKENLNEIDYNIIVDNLY
jgi:hypothetical protein